MLIRIALALAATLTLATLTACGAEDPTATLVMPAKVSSAQEVTVEGAYSLEKAGLEVTLTSKGDDEVLANTTTAKDGRYKLTFTPAGTGRLTFVASVTDGEERTASKARNLLVLGNTVASVKLKGNSEARIGATRSLVGKVEPASEARTVTVQTSPDAQAWTPTTVTGTTDPTGSFVLTVDTSTAGSQYLRVLVEASDTLSEASTAETFLGVYDYKAAGQRYLKCVEELNVKAEEYSDLPSVAARRDSASRMAKRSTDQAKCLRGFEWPPSVAEDVEQIAQNDDLDADVWNQMAATTDDDEFVDLSYTFTTDTGPATRIRAKLALAKRPAD
jgi:hypothetical protein